jgi:3-phenylpropionate/trans-cinnamate dioxygenase ferredoxin reductase subunit
VDLALGVRATGLDPGARTLTLEDGRELRYASLLLATGARPRVMGAEPSERVLYLRRLEDAERIRDHLGEGKRLVMVGAGFIGCEVAASARSVGTEVQMINGVHVPLERVVGREIGTLLKQVHEERGVRVVMEQMVDTIEETSSGAVVATQDGGRFEGDVVVVGIGVVPNTELAEEAGLEVERGILVDARCATSAEGVFAAGDVAGHDHPIFGRIRVEHYDNALKMGAHAGRAMLGAEDPFGDPHWFWSDQYDQNIQMAGFAASWDDLIVRGSMEEREFTAFYLQDGMVRSVLAWNRGRDARRGMKLVAAEARPDPEALRDDDRDLRDLVPGR